MKKINIVTLYGNSNFGNKLQNYALQEVCENLNFEVQTLKNKYEQPFVKKVKSHIKVFLIKIIRRNLITSIKREHKFKQFGEKYLKYTKTTVTAKNIDRKKRVADYNIIGSDQVWNLNDIKNIKIMFALFDRKEKNISYAASFGVTQFDKNMNFCLKEGIENISHISVREEAGKNIIEKLTGRKDVEVLVDPTMLLSEKNWLEIAKKPKNMFNEKYILNYFLGKLSEDRKKQIYRIAEEKGWKIINLLDPRDPYYISGPAEFLYLEKNAELICTDSFHSAVFGILFNTPFIVYDRKNKGESMNSRLETLLSKFKLEERKYNGELDEKHIFCDFSNCQTLLDKERKKAYNFLKKTLGVKD